MMIYRVLVFLATTILFLSACHSPVYDQTVSNVADAKLLARDARLKSDRDAKVCPSLVVKPGPYVDLTPVSLDKEPGWLRNPIVIRGDELPFSYYSRTISLGGSNNVLNEFQNNLDQTVRVSMNYTGTIKGALDLLAARTGYVYTVHKNTIRWHALITKTFDIAFMPGSSDYMLGNTSGTSGTTTASSSTAGTVANYVSSDYSSAEFSSLKGTLSVWKDLEATLNRLKSQYGTVTVSESTTTVTVTDRLSNIQLMSKYITNLNKTLSRQVLIKVQILNVKLENDFTFGINWGLVAKAFTNSLFQFNANYGTPVSITPFTQQTGQQAGGPVVLPSFGTVAQTSADGSAKIPSYQILFNALNQQGKTSVVQEPRAVCMNNQVSVIRVVNSVGYLASVQNTSLAGSGTTTPGSTNIGTVTSQITPGTVITGLTLYLLPKILGDKIYLQVNADYSVLNSIATLSSGGNTATATTIQAPDVDTQHFNQRSMLRSGDTMILSGFRSLSNEANASQFLKYQSLGGKGAQMKSYESVILITPYILPGSV